MGFAADMPAFSRFLRYFLVVGRSGSIRRAADELNVSASAIDRQILNAEAEIGMPLFERLPAGLRLTAAGEVLMAAGLRWQKGLGDALRQLEDLRGLKRGHVEIAVNQALAHSLLPQAMARVRGRYPGISLGLAVMEDEAVRVAVAQGRVDFGLCFEPESIRDLTVHGFAQARLGVVGPQGDALARGASLRFSALADEPMILPAAPLAAHSQLLVLQGAAKLGLRKVASVDNVSAMLALVRAGLGLGMITDLEVDGALEPLGLQFTPISDPILKPLTLALCSASSRSTSYAAEMVLGEIGEALSALKS